MQVYLIGYMGVGKTTLGKKLAKRLSLKFLDLDAEIVKAHQKSISQLFAERGEDEFRKMERHALLNIQNSTAVIATGGGAPCFYDNMDIMLSSGIVVWLKLDAEKLVNRLKGAKTKRPLIADLNSDELYIFVKNQLSNREKFYERAHLQVDAFSFDKLAMDALVEKIENYIK